MESRWIPRQAHHFLGLICAIQLLPGCGDVSTSIPVAPPREYRVPTFGARDSVFTDDQVLDATYSTYQAPPGFYTDRTYPLPYYSNTVSIERYAYPSDAPFQELATEDPGQARAWAESTNVHMPYTAPIDTIPVVTARYFHFDCPYVAGIPFTVPVRVHRESYFTPSSFDPYLYPPWPETLVGTFHSPVTEASVRGLVEYLWFSWFQWQPAAPARVVQETRGRPLSSYGWDEPGQVSHRIYSAELTKQSEGVCDRIQIVHYDFRVDEATGEVFCRRTGERYIVGKCPCPPEYGWPGCR